MTLASISIRFNGEELMGYYIQKGNYPQVTEHFQFVMLGETREFNTLKEAMDFWGQTW